MPASPMATSAAATTMGTMPERVELDRPHRRSYRPRMREPSAPSWTRRRPPTRPRRPPPTSVASHDGRRRLDASSAAPKPRPTTVSAKAASDRTHSSPFSGKRRPANCPAAAPVPAAAKAAKRSWRSAGPRSAAPRSTGAMRTWRTSGASTASGPPRLPDRRPDEARERGGDAEPGRPVGAHPLDPGGRQRLVADDGGQHGHHRDDRDPDQVHLVQRVDPVDLRDPLPAPRPSKVADDRDGHRERVGHYSSTSSMRVPQIALGWTKATVVPRDPGRGASSITLWPCALTASSATRAVVDPVADVVQALALVGRGTWPPASRHGWA